ncbi:MAG: IPT/TIG domain-containing protein [Bifidobacteriaceae bacterium]|jgi:hypothetical protein|nr:IPT/TIG domain-containing protein [Bifidobacteriaceae bacterium]
MVKNLKKAVAQKVMVGKKSDNSAHKRKLIPSIALACMFAVIIVSGTVYVAYNAFSASNCANMQSGTELCINSFTPDNGYATGGDWVTVKGTGFKDKATTSDYDTTGLVAHYDGINNINAGDERHATNSSTWKNLANTNLDLALQSGSNAFESNGFKIKDAHNVWYKSGTGTVLPTGSSSFTAEIRYAIGGTMHTGVQTPLFWGTNASNNTANFIGLRNTNTFTEGFWYNEVDVPYTGANSTPNTLSVTYQNGTGNEKTARKIYVSGESHAYVAATASSGYMWAKPNVTNTLFCVGALVENGNCLTPSTTSINLIIQSVRIYNRALTPAEIQNNATVDDNRFVHPLDIQIGDASCQEIIVVSDAEANCKLPKSTKQSAEVKITFGGASVTAENEFIYNHLQLISISPNIGNTNAGNTVTINGSAFPYVADTEYAKTGLVAHYDAINNLGLGDMHHASNSTVWADLSSSKANLTLHNAYTPAGYDKFDSNGFTVKNINNYWYAPYFNALPTGNSEFTAEMRYTFVGNGLIGAGPWVSLAWGKRDYNKANIMGFRSATALTEGFWYNDLDVSFPGAKTTPNTYAVTYKSGTGYEQGARRIYGNAQTLSYTPTTTGSYLWNVPQVASGAAYCLFVGAVSQSNGCGTAIDVFYNNTNLVIQSVRIYNRTLSDLEIAHNYAIDEKRFVQPPTVMIGSSECKDVVVISTTKLQCTAPTGTLGAKPVTVSSGDTTETLDDAYTYVNEQSMSITAIDPKVGPSFGGSKIRLTGKNLDILKVTIAGKECTKPDIADDKTIYTCTVPEAESITQDTFVDVIVTPNTGNNYVFAQGFQYIFARKNPVEFNVE